jgi:hypothetical protein
MPAFLRAFFVAQAFMPVFLIMFARREPGNSYMLLRCLSAMWPCPTAAHKMQGIFMGSSRMPEKETIERANQDAREGKAPSTQAGEFVREEMDHIRQGKHGARSAKQAIAIGLSKARRAGVKLPPPDAGKTSPDTARHAASDYRKGQSSPNSKPARNRSRATHKALEREGTEAASHKALSRQAHRAARTRGSADLRRAAEKAARTRERSKQR